MSHARSSFLFQALSLSTDTPTTSSSPPQEPAPAAAAFPPPTMTPTDWPDEAEEIICYYRKMREEGNSPLLDATKVPDDVYMGTEEDIKKWRLLNKWKKRSVLEDDLEEDLSNLEDLEEHIKDLEKNIEDLEEDLEDLEEEDDSDDDWDLISDPEDFFFYNDSEHHDNNNDDYISDIVEGPSDYELHIRNVILALDERIHVEPLFLPWATILSMTKLHASLLVEIRDAYHAKQQQDRLDRSNAEPGAAEIIRRASIATASNAETMRLVWEYRARLRTELQEACRAREVRRSLAETAEAVVAALGEI